MKARYFLAAAVFAGVLLIVKGAPALPVLIGVGLVGVGNWMRSRSAAHRSR